MEVCQLVVHLVEDGYERLQHLLVDLSQRVNDLSMLGAVRQVAHRHLQHEAFEDVAVNLGTVHKCHS